MSLKLKLMSGIATVLLISGAAWAQTTGQSDTTQTVPNVQQQTQPGADDAEQPQGQTRERRQRQQAQEADDDGQQDQGQRRQRQQAQEADDTDGQAEGQTRERQRQQAQQPEDDSEQAQEQRKDRKDRQQAQEPKDDTEQAQEQQKDRKDRQQARDRDQDGQEEATEERRDRKDRKEARRERDKDRVDIDTTINIDISSRERTIIYERLLTADIEPVSTSVEVVVGETVPTVVALHPVPTEVVEVVPEFRNHMHFALADERVAIVDPCTMRIVAIIS